MIDSYYLDAETASLLKANLKRQDQIDIAIRFDMAHETLRSLIERSRRVTHKTEGMIIEAKRVIKEKGINGKTNTA